MGALAQQLQGRPTLDPGATVRRGGARVASLEGQRPLTSQQAAGARGIRQDVLQKQAQQQGLPPELSEALLRFGLGSLQAQQQPPQLVDIGGGFLAPIQRGTGQVLGAGLQAGLGGLLEGQGRRRAEAAEIRKEERRAKTQTELTELRSKLAKGEISVRQKAVTTRGLEREERADIRKREGRIEAEAEADRDADIILAGLGLRDVEDLGALAPTERLLFEETQRKFDEEQVKLAREQPKLSPEDVKKIAGDFLQLGFLFEAAQRKRKVGEENILPLSRAQEKAAKEFLIAGGTIEDALAKLGIGIEKAKPDKDDKKKQDSILKDILNAAKELVRGK